MKLDLDHQGPRHFTIDVDGTLQLGVGGGYPAEVALSGTLEVQDIASRVLVTGSLEAKGSTECGRCLSPFVVAWSVPAELMVLRQADDEERQDTMPVIVQSHGAADLKGLLREFAVLSCPQRRVCQEDCRGICMTCGADLNRESCDCVHEEIDPRWDGLPE